MDLSVRTHAAVVNWTPLGANPERTPRARVVTGSLRHTPPLVQGS